MNTLPWRCTERFRNWERKNPSDLERRVCYEMETSWCTPGRLRDFRDTSLPSTSEKRGRPSLSIKPWAFPQKSRWSFIPTSQTMPELIFLVIPTNWIHVMLLSWSMNEITIYYYSILIRRSESYPIIIAITFICSFKYPSLSIWLLWYLKYFLQYNYLIRLRSIKYRIFFCRCDIPLSINIFTRMHVFFINGFLSTSEK